MSFDAFAASVDALCLGRNGCTQLGPVDTYANIQVYNLNLCTQEGMISENSDSHHCSITLWAPRFSEMTNPITVSSPTIQK